MGMVVRSNIMAVNSQRQLGMNSTQVGKSLEKLSSGFRINRAGDDASGLAISEKMKAQIKGLDTASLNSQDGVSLVQTAEGALTEVQNMLNRMTELATRSANGINSDQNRQALQKEVDKLKDEIDRISESTNFNGINLLDGSLADGNLVGIKQPKSTDVKYTVGDANSKTKATFDLTGMKAYGSGQVTFTVGGKDFHIDVVESDTEEKIAEKVADALNEAEDLFSNITSAGALGAAGKLTAKAEGNKVVLEAAVADKDLEANLKEALQKGISIKASTKTPDFVKGDTVSLDFSKVPNNIPDKKKITIAGQTLTISSTGDNSGLGKVKLGTTTAETLENIAEVLAKQTGIKEKWNVESKGDKLVFTAKTNVSADDADDVKIDATATNTEWYGTDMINRKVEATGKGLALQIGDTSDAFNRLNVKIGSMSASGIGVGTVDIGTRQGASDAIDVIRAAIDKVSDQRATMGAAQNRLEYTINNLDTASENLQAANSRIRDTDMAKQMMEFTKLNVLTQSAQAMLAQANQQPQSILQLLQ